MREILVCMRSAGHSQRDFLAGVAAYARTKGDWTIRFDPNPSYLKKLFFARYGERMDSYRR